MNAKQIAAMMGIRTNFILGAKIGIKALVGQYVTKENGRYVDKSEVINALRNKYSPGAATMSGHR